MLDWVLVVVDLYGVGFDVVVFVLSEDVVMFDVYVV